MSRAANSDVFFLLDEKFDFDVSLSPASSTGDDFEDEVFIGPVGHNERCISANVASRVKNSGARSSWSPLSGDQLDAICEEAHKLVTELRSSEHAQIQSENIDPNCAQKSDGFVQDSEAKLQLFSCSPRTVLSPIKRETFCVQDSPLKQLPPAIQSRILNAHGPKTKVGSKANTGLGGKTKPTDFPVPLKTFSSPGPGTKPQTRTSLRVRSSMGVSSVLPSRPTAPKAAPTNPKNCTDKNRLQPSNKLSTTWRRSPTSSRNGSCEDLLSDSASVASDVSDCSLNSSGVAKRTLAPPTKKQSLGVQSLSGVRPPSDRRKTSSSSSSVSSFNSSFSQSPANKAGKRSLSQASLSSVPEAKQPQGQKSRRSVVVQPVPPTRSAVGRRSLSTHVQKPSHPTPQTRKPSQPTPQTRKPSQPTPQTRNPSHPTPQTQKSSNPTPFKRLESSPAHTPTRKGSERPGPAHSTAKNHGAKTKPQATVLPTPNGALHGTSSPNLSKVMKPKRLVSVKSLDSLPLKPALTPSAGSSRALQLKPRRPSALPTPLRSRPSGLPQTTPTSQVQATRAPSTPLSSKPSGLPQTTPTSQVRATRLSPNPSLTSAESESLESADIQPLNLDEGEEEEPEQCLPPPAEHYQSEPTAVPVAVCVSQTEAGEEAEQEHTLRLTREPTPEPTLEPTLEPSRETTLEPTLKPIIKAQPEMLLMDLPTPALQPQEKLLIDLSQTPDLLRNKSCPSSTELIDLSSPLIKWSPEEKKDVAPLINLSF